ncbi:universal stress protein [Aureitalea sp. L0-47]|uniref:universal stress protein n=1 Tax=Aureitalea sp. L0-47 TaxID=2816962 RepID=UPI00223820BF|nr:universal stress protein [Aureitalea sp. L0-47]MCW5519808.1 universal stress protein [Aureitalea sp. L0-47]
MKNILLPTDFSENSFQAMDYAMKYFSGQNMKFVILNIQKSSDYIMDDLMTASPGSSVHEAISADNKSKINDVVDRYRSEYSDEAFEFEGLFDFDVFIDGIAQTVASRNIDLIVMGTNGASGAREAIFGSNTLNVIRQIKCPVLAIPENYEFDELKKMLFTVIDEKYPSEEALQPFMDFIELYKPELHILHIDEKRSNSEVESSKEFNSMFDDLRVKNHYLKGIPAPMAIHSFTQLISVDMHSILIEQKQFLDRFIHGSDTSKISYATKVPLLVMHD